MIIDQLSTIPTSSGLYWCLISYAKSNPISKNLYIPTHTAALGIGSLPIGFSPSSLIIVKDRLTQILPSNGQQTSTPAFLSNAGVVDYVFDNSNVVGSIDAGLENIVLALKTNYNSSSVSDFGLRQRAIIPQNYKNIIKNDILLAIRSVIDSGLIKDVNIDVTKQGSSIYANINYTSNGIKTTYSYNL